MVEVKVEMEHTYVRGITIDQLAKVLGQIEEVARRESPQGARDGIRLEASEGDEGQFEIALTAEREALPYVKNAVEDKIQQIPSAERYWYIGILGALVQEIDKSLS